MKVKFTTLRVQADDSGLIALHLPGPATVKVLSTQVWLTHSQSNQDYVLKQGTTLSVTAGLVLIDGESAMVEVRAVETSVFKQLIQRMAAGLRKSKLASCAVCVRA